MMLKINDRFTCEMDGPHSWILKEMVQTQKKSAKNTERIQTSYYGTLRQCLDAVIDRSTSECYTADDVKRKLLETEDEIKAALDVFFGKLKAIYEEGHAYKAEKQD